MIRSGGRGQWFVLAMFTRAKMRQSEQYMYGKWAFVDGKGAPLDFERGIYER